MVLKFPNSSYCHLKTCKYQNFSLNYKYHANTSFSKPVSKCQRKFFYKLDQLWHVSLNSLYSGSNLFATATTVQTMSPSLIGSPMCHLHTGAIRGLQNRFHRPLQLISTISFPFGRSAITLKKFCSLSNW